MSDCDGTLKNLSFQHRPLLKKVNFGYSWCSKCPPRSQTHDRRRGRHCFMARSMITWSKHRLIFSGPSMSQFKLKSGRLRAGDVTYGKNKTSIMGIGLSSILSVLFKPKKIKE